MPTKAKPTGTKRKEISANPGKTFFVNMLTRDLSLEDAILDLLDNCVDGALRVKQNTDKQPSDKFNGFRADIVIAPDHFSISDNCGGIPESKLEYAFMHGRPKDISDKGIPTVGIYGIGMKRAIYKMGLRARVATKSGKLQCEVPFTPEWMKSEKWKLPVLPTTVSFKKDGTVVEVTALRDEVQKVFSIGLADFEKRLRTIIGEHYAYLINHGFEVFLNGEVVAGRPVDLQFQSDDGDTTVRPFFWETEDNGVKVFLSVGFYRPPPTQEVSSDAEGEENWSSEDSGWTVLCNHRVVAYCDKSHLTGWGDRPIPRFHPQFNAIRGIVVFESADASRLPTTTTKRGLDVGHKLYAEVKNVMKEGMRIFIDSTNRWKGETDRSRKLLQADSIKKLGLDELRVRAKALLAPNRGAAGGKIYKPVLPEPKRETTSVWIRYSKDSSEVVAVAEYMLRDSDAKPAAVGEACFDYFLKKTRQ